MPRPTPPEPSRLSPDDGRKLVALAHAAVAAAVRDEPPPPIPDDAFFNDRRGVFVTVHVRGQLRGCIGYPLPIKPLGAAIIDLAASAALRDHRFDPVAPGELADLDVEVSALTVPHAISAVTEIEVGRHGLIVGRGHLRGLLLPQVATEYGWDVETFLEHTCMKAGLPRDAWKQPGTDIQAFEAQVFGDR